MPNRDGTGPQGNPNGPGRKNLGPGGRCVCPNCGATALHKRGVPCTKVKCSKCGTQMVRS